MDLEYFHEFLALAETRNYLQAADSMSISQSSLSRHISAMEQGLGTPLFRRTTRRVSLTEAGEALIPYARSITAAQFDYTSALRKYVKEKDAAVRVGTVPMMPYYGISELLFSYRQANPDVCLTIQEDSITSLYEKLRLHRLDYAFVLEGGKPNPEFARLPFLTDAMAVLLPKKHPLAKNEHLRLSQLKKETVFTLSGYTLTSRLTQDAFSDAGYTPKLVHCGAQLDNIAEHVEAGEGVSVISMRAAQTIKTADTVILPLSPSISANINIVFCRSTHFSGAARHFLNCAAAGAHTTN